MWSFGCLLYELYTAYPIFAGDTEHDQLLAIMEVLGVPDAEFLYVLRELFLKTNSNRTPQD